jgi:hypothetical protein
MPSTGNWFSGIKVSWYINQFLITNPVRVLDSDWVIKQH